MDGAGCGRDYASLRVIVPEPSPEVEHRERMVLWAESRPNYLGILFFNKWRDSVYAKEDIDDDVDDVTHDAFKFQTKKSYRY